MLSDYSMPVIVALVIMFALFKKSDVYSDFTFGAGEGLKTAGKILPSLVGLLVAIKMFSASGAMDCITKFVSPVSKVLHFPKQAVPFALMRPVSGSGSLAMATEIFKNWGPDSFVGRVVSVMMGSTETTFYAVSVYFGAVGVKNTRHTLACGLFADVVSMIASAVVCSMYW